MRDKKISKNKKIDAWVEIRRRLMELKSKQNNPINSSDAEKVEKLTDMVSQELVDVLTVIIENCDQMLMRLKKDEPLYSHVEEIKGTAEHALYLNNKLFSLNRDNHVARTDTTTKK